METKKIQAISQVKEHEEALEHEIDERWKEKKSQNQILTLTYWSLQEALDLTDRKIERVDNCGSWLEFQDIGEGFKLHTANFCKDRLCPLCQWRRSLKMFSQLSSVMDYMATNDPYKDYRYAFLTLTIRNCAFEELDTCIDVLLSGYKQLTNKSKLWRKGIVAGSFRSLEVIVSKDGEHWHPHLHVILALIPDYFKRGNDHTYMYYMTTEQWSDLWGECAGLDYAPVVDIRMLKSYNPESTVPVQDIYKKAVAEAAKYSVKGSQFLWPEDLDRTKYLVYILKVCLENRQLYSFQGCFRKVRKLLKLDDPEDGDLVHVDGDEQINSELEKQIIVYRWSGGGYLRCSAQ